MGRRHIPQRTCVACRQIRNKRDLMRVVRTSEGHIEVDETGKKPGRGAYLCRQASCWKLALERKSLDRALKVSLTSNQKEHLASFAGSLPEELDLGEAET